MTMNAMPRLYPILDVTLLAQRKLPVLEAARVLLDSGIHLMQWRCKTAIGRRELDELDRLAELCARASAMLIVNDRADVAAMVEAPGVHVGQQDLAPEAVRRLMGPAAFIGFSTHNHQQFIQATGEPVDYIALGPIFGTTTKENPDPEVGVEMLARCASETHLPLVAIGGITRANAQQVLEAGAASLAVIGDLFPDPCTPDALRQRLAEWAMATEAAVL